ncbi:MAG: excinuclease ABC subunit UvrB [Candidatus Mcinerneyibacterium aminivorans]|uniref:UvrABC system protein B n=1 Tax=Candidatus Mcinerneyibacterium aminivorans TaxID=2703815 RepID=A0A5D0MEN5_9BACT|nr:MAG: excinuclease ABC subunit UvrB [Candidatus Mcinerneyibacterium aminivorans]
MSRLKVVSDFDPLGDQPKAIEKLTKNYNRDRKRQTLLGVTGSGKTFTFSKVIENLNRPTLVLSHNKTLAGQLYTELKGFFPDNKVCYYVSYFDYYQPEAYVPQTDTYIEKDSSINEDIDRMRLEAITSLLTRNDVIVVASVSAIYSVGAPGDYKRGAVVLQNNSKIKKMELIRKFIDIYYERNDMGFFKGDIRSQGDTVDVFPPYENNPVRITMWGDEIDSIYYFDYLTGKKIEEVDSVRIFPATYYVTSERDINKVIAKIKKEMKERVAELEKKDKILEAQRLKMRTNYDIEMLQEIGYCKGIENYSRYLTGREEGERPFVLLDYFPDDYLTIIDESHMTVPQIHGMYRGDRARKEKLVEHGFRLPSALDNRPLTFDEFDKLLDKVMYVSATPADYEREISDNIVEQIVRPTGLLDPEVEVRETEGQIYDLMEEAKKTIKNDEKILVTTLTKKMAEDLTSFLKEKGLKAEYLHSEIGTMERIETLNDLRTGKYDIIVGINLLREGMDLPEVSRVMILDADKEGFLRSYRALIQVGGRAARNVNGRVIMYADKITDSMQKMIDETNRRRKIQKKFNEEHNIEPKTIQKEVKYSSLLEYRSSDREKKKYKFNVDNIDHESIPKMIEELRSLMQEKSDKLLFEEAAEIRDQIYKLKEKWEEDIRI